MNRRRLVLAVLALLTVGGVGAYIARDSDDPTDDLRAVGAATTSSSAPDTTTVTTPPSTLGSSTSATPTSAPASTTIAPAPPFESSVESVTAAQLGSSWHPNMGCAEPAELRLVAVTRWGYDGEVHQGRLVVAAAQADRIVAAFRDIYAARFPIERMEPIDAYGGDDQASMAGNNTSAFNCRTVAGSARLSEHAYGRAIDVNPLRNPYVRADGQVDPLSGAPFADRSRTDPGIIHEGDAAVAAFAAQGWQWGGHWSAGKDYQHFSTSGR